MESRILKALFRVLVFAMLMGTVTGYFFFARIVRQQNISNEEAQQEQVKSQMIFMMEDIENFARNIIADDRIQEILLDNTEKTTYDAVKEKNDFLKRLRFYNSLRTYCSGSFVVLENGNKYTSTGVQQAEYVKQRLALEELEEYNQHPEWILSMPYYGINSWDTKPVVCYRASMLDQHEFNKKLGTLYLEIDLQYLLSAIEAYGKESEDVCLMGSNKAILYQSKENSTAVKILTEDSAYQMQGVHKVREGYLIVCDIEKMGTKVCKLITNAYLWKRSMFVPIFFLLSFLVILTLVLVTIRKQLAKIIRPVKKLSEKMKKTNYDQLEELEMVSTEDEIQVLYERFNDMMQEIQSGKMERNEYEKRTKEMEFSILLSQINPHYLYNVLNTVVYLSAMNMNAEVTKVVNSLIYSMQETMRIGENNIETTVEKELELTRCYVTIQKSRYPDIFSVEIRCEEIYKACCVPKTVIQPLVENALIHGILPTDGKGVIKIEIYQENEQLFIQVGDNGVGMDREVLEKFNGREDIVYSKHDRKHIGISNIRDRIEYLYGAEYGMEIKCGKDGTEILLKLPFKIM